jgi:hypothetical protein
MSGLTWRYFSNFCQDLAVGKMSGMCCRFTPTNVKIKFDNQNIVQEINLVTFGGNLYLHNIVLTYGNPKQVLFHNKDHEYVAVDLLYPESGMIIKLFLLNSGGEIPRVKIKENDKILGVYLV